MSHWKFIPGTEHELYFLTSAVVEWTHVFTERVYFDIVIQSLAYCQQHKDLLIAGYVIMPNHIHLICAGSEKHRLSDTMRDFKHYTARNILDELQRNRRWKELEIFQRAAREEGKGNAHKFWNVGSHPILVDSAFMFQEKLKYIHENPLRKGFVDTAEHWLFSSARNYVLDDHSIL